MASFLETIFKYLPLSRYNTTPPTPANGELVEFQSDAEGRLRVTLEDAETTWNNPGAATSERVIKNTSGKIHRLWITNTGVSTKYLFLFNHDQGGSLRPANGSTGQLVVAAVAGGQSFAIEYGTRPYPATVGIYWGASSTPGSFTYDASATFSVATEFA